MSDRPRLDRPTLALPSIPGYNEALWETLLQLAGTEPQQEWTLIGGQMVLLHALQHDVEPTRLSTDIDVVINARVVTGGIQSFVKTLESLGFSLVGVSPEGIANRCPSTSCRTPWGPPPRPLETTSENPPSVGPPPVACTRPEPRPHLHTADTASYRKKYPDNAAECTA